MAAASSASAQSADESTGEEIIMNAWAKPSDCNRAIAKAVRFSALVADAERLMDKCIAVEGFWAGRALFGSQHDAKVRGSNAAKQLQGQRIGLYAQWEKLGEPPKRPARTLFIGRLGQCETQWPGAMMVMGYCHYTGGPILLVSEAFPR